jgi:hypothetical protein
MGNKSTHKPIVTRKLISLIISKGFYNAKGTKHGKYTREGDDHKIMIPRHKQLKPGLSADMCKELKEKHQFSDEEISRLF